MVKGEGITDSSVWFIKTHYPERHGYKIYGIDRCILIIRNPFDAIESYFHMAMTNTHNKTLTPQVFFSYFLSFYLPLFFFHQICVRFFNLFPQFGFPLFYMKYKFIYNFIYGGYNIVYNLTLK